MKIRHGTQADDDAIIFALKKFADQQPLGRLKVEAKRYNDHHVRKVLDAVRRTGLLLIAQDDEHIAGVFMASISGDIWVPSMSIMSELIWWVNPEYRNSSAGLRLLKEYTKIGEQMVEQGKISMFTMTLLSNSPSINLEKRGWSKLETNYVHGVI